MKKLLTMRFGLIVCFLGILLLAGCSDIFSPPEVLREGAGQGSVTINIGNGGASRTLFPQTPVFSRYKLVFTPEDGQDEVEPVWVTNTSYSKVLEAGNWTITVTAYIDINGIEDIPDDEYEAARGSAGLNVESGSACNITVDIRGIVDDGEGTFNYDISLPDAMNTATLKIVTLSGDTEQDINLLDDGASGSFNLASGYYILYLTMQNADGRIVKVEVIHIYKNMITSAEGEGYTFTESDFWASVPVPDAVGTPALSAGTDEISVSWEAAANAVSYNVQYREDNEAFKYYGDATTDTSVTITGLKSNTKYYVQVRARNTSGPGAWSDAADTVTIATLPGQISQPSVTAGSGELSVSWSAVSSATAYEVWYRIAEEGGNGQQFTTDAPITETGVLLGGLQNGTAYQVRVRAVNSTGEGEYSPWSASRTPDGDLAPAPAMPTVTNITYTGFTVSWQSVVRADAYSVWLATVNNPSQASRQGNWVDAAAEKTMAIEELNPGTVYYLWVRARNADGVSGAFSPAAKAVTPLPAPVITGVTGAKERLTVSMITRIAIEAEGGGEYDITQDPNYNSSYPVLQNDVWYADSNPVKYYQFYAQAGVSYAVRWNDSYQGNGTKSADIGVSAKWIDNNTTIFNRTDSGWNSPQTFAANRSGIVLIQVEHYSGGNTSGTYAVQYYETGGSPSGPPPEYVEITGIQAYDVYLNTNYWDSPSAYTIPTLTVTGDSSATIRELNPNQTYYVWVRAKNDNNGEWVFSDWSSQSQGRVPNNGTALTGFRLYANWTSYYGTYEGNLIRVTVPYERNLSSIEAHFNLSSGAQASITSGDSSNFSAPKDITVTAEDGETRAVYTVIVRVTTPIQINFAGPDDVDASIDFSANGVLFKMAAVPVPEGGITFPTGDNDSGRATVARPYQIAETAVTWEQWNTVRTWAVSNGYSMSEGRRGSSGNGSDQQPVTMMNWYDAVVWCNALTEYWNEKTGTVLETVYNNGENPLRNAGNTGEFNGLTPSEEATGFRLPRSMEWELAARWRNDSTNTVAGFSNPWFTKGDSASGATAYYNDGSATGSVAVYNANGTAIVKSKTPNTLGLYDMSGNVWEWCIDSQSSTTRTTRGGAYENNAQLQRVGYVHSDAPGSMYNNHGFRIARDGTLNDVNVTAIFSAPEGYAAYKWIVDNADAGVSDNTLTLDWSTLAFGPHSVTVFIYREEGGIQTPYSKTITFTVTP